MAPAAQRQLSSVAKHCIVARTAITMTAVGGPSAPGLAYDPSKHTVSMMQQRLVSLSGDAHSWPRCQARHRCI